MLTLAEGMIPADPIGAEEIIVRSRQVLAAATVRPDQKPTRPREARPTYGPVDEVAAAAKFRSVMARLELTNLMGCFVRAWIAVWARSPDWSAHPPDAAGAFRRPGLRGHPGGSLGDLADGRDNLQDIQKYQK